MTVRSIILGLLAAAFITATGYVNDQILKSTYMVGNHLPISVFGLLILFLLVFNPLLKMISPKLALAPKELAVILGAALISCSIPNSGLMRYFTTSISMPHRWQESDLSWKQKPDSWRQKDLVQYIPPAMLMDKGDPNDRNIDKLLTGISTGDRHIRPSDIPWRLWQRTLLFWLPLIALMMTAVVSMSLILHRQWSKREHLRYPIAAFAESLLGETPGKKFNNIFRNKMFWYPCAAVLAIHIINGLYAWYPAEMVHVPLSVNLTALAQKWPTITSVRHTEMTLVPQLYIAVFAFSFFLAGDVSFTLGITHYIYIMVWAMLITAGVGVEKEAQFGGGYQAWIGAGAYIGMAIMLLYSGRRYYGAVFRRALFLGGDESGKQGAWAMRILLLASGGMVGILVWHELDWLLAMLIVVIILLQYVILARLISETGMFMFNCGWYATGLLGGFFGPAVLGPQAMLILALIMTVFAYDVRESLMPFLMNAWQVSDRQSVRLSRLSVYFVVVLVIALLIGTFATLYVQYDNGMLKCYSWARDYISRQYIDQANNAMDNVYHSGRMLEDQPTGLARLAAMNPQKGFFASLLTGMAGVIVLTILRRRFSWWPIHPLLAVMWGTWPLDWFGPSFLLGWIARTIIVKFGGMGGLRRFQTVAVGLIAGDLLGGLLWMVNGAIYYAAKGFRAPIYWIFPS